MRGSRLVLTAGMASYLDAGALVTTGLAVGVFYRPALSLGDIGVGVLLGLQTLSFAIGALGGGRLGDRVGRRRVLVLALTLYAVGVALLAVAWTPSVLATGVVVTGLAIGADLPVSLALIGEEAPRGHRGRFIAMAQLLWVLGIAVTGLLAFLLAGYGETAARLLYLHLLVVSLVVLALRLSLTESREWRAAKDRTTPPEASTEHIGAGVAARSRAPRASARVVLALGAYYALWNLGANTLGQFKPFLWVNVMGGEARGASILILAVLPLGIAGGMTFVRLVDTRHRQNVLAAASLVALAGWAATVVWPLPPAFVALSICFVVGASFSGEAIYKVWVQEMTPVLSRASVQGLTLAGARVAAAAFGVATPALATSHPRLLFALLFAASLVATLIALWWIPRLSKDLPLSCTSIGEPRARG